MPSTANLSSMPQTSTPATRPAIAPLPPRVREATEALHALLSRELAGSVNDALDATHRELFRLSERSTAPVLQVHWLGNLQRLVDKRHRLLPRLLAELGSALESLRTPAPPGAPVAPQVEIRAEDMRLVEETGPDEAAMIDELGRRQEARAGLPLLLLGQRFGVLAEAPAFAAATLPVGARGLACHFMRAADELALDTDARKVLLRAFEREVMPGYPALAEAMNGTLDRVGVLPGLSYVPLRPRPAARPGTPAPVAGDSGESAYARPPPREAEGTAPAAASAVASRGVLDETQGLAQMRQWLVERRHLLARLSDNEERPAPRSMGSMELDNVLAALQVGKPMLRTAAGLRRAIQEQASRLGSTSSLSDEAGDALVLFATLCEKLQAHTNPQVHDLLAAMQMPLLRLAVRDPGFLVQESAAPRQLLATVVEVGAGHHGPDAMDPQLLQRMREVVGELSLQYPHDTDVFERANAALLEPQQAAVRRAEIAERRHVEAARGRERLLSARRHAAAAVEWALAGHEPPRFQRTLLDQAWTDALALVALRQGTGSQQWQEYIATTAEIARALRDGTTAPAVHHARIQDALGLLGYHPEQAAGIAAHLAGGDGAGEDPASRTELVMGMRGRNRLGGGGVPDGEGLPHPADVVKLHPGELEWLARLESFSPGHWIGFDAPGCAGGTLRLRLAWHGEDSGRVLLLGVRGHPPAEPPATTLQGVARLVASGKARLLGESPPDLLDSTWRAMIDTLMSHSPDAGPAHPGADR